MALPRTNNIWTIILLAGMAASWFLGVVFFIIGIMLIVGVFGNSHPLVIEATKCDTDRPLVASCARIFGFRTEGVAVIIISFFFFAWGAVLTISLLINKTSRKGTPGRVILTPTYKTQYATSVA